MERRRVWERDVRRPCLFALRQPRQVRMCYRRVYTTRPWLVDLIDRLDLHNPYPSQPNMYGLVIHHGRVTFIAATNFWLVCQMVLKKGDDIQRKILMVNHGEEVDLWGGLRLT